VFCILQGLCANLVCIMVNNNMMFRLSEEIAFENRRAVEHRTVYAIQLTCGAYARVRRTWTQTAQDAMHFDFMTSAIAYAYSILELNTEDFSIVPLCV
jgi:hypothetical protein